MRIASRTLDGDTILELELKPNVLMYLDDVIICNRTFEDHLRTLREVFRRLREARLRLSEEKCRFCVDRIKYLGHIIE